MALDSDQILLLSKRLLDPRRVPAAQMTNEDREEGIVPYEPLLIPAQRAIISYHLDVARTERLLSSPALLESTSVVCATGLDLFCTRVTPSGTFDHLTDQFNHSLLLATIVGLLVAIVITRRLAAKRTLDSNWR